jgi:hypothetical protein
LNIYIIVKNNALSRNRFHVKLIRLFFRIQNAGLEKENKKVGPCASFYRNRTKKGQRKAKKTG